MATALTVLTTTVLPQGVVYASEPTGITSELDVSEDDSEMPSEESVESTETETPSEEIVVNTETETPSEAVVEESTEESLDDETKKANDKETTLQKDDAEDEIADVAVEEEADETGAEEVPAVGDVVSKHTINVEPDNPESSDTTGKDTYWKLVWNDEFNTGKLDMSKWDYQAGDGSDYGVAGWGNNEKEYYTDGDEDGSNNITFDEEHLIITAKKENMGSSTYTSGKLWTKGDAYNSGDTEEPLYAKKYGRIEAKMSLPAGTGYWPAFWMMPLDDKYGGWASSGEIDIMEARGRVTNSVDGTIHFGNAWPNNKSRGGQYDANKTSAEAQNFDFTEEHVYAVEWLPGVMKWYVDDQCYYTATNWYSTKEGNGDNFTYPAPYDQEFFIMLNLAVGGNYDSGKLDDISGGQMKVDYVRVYDLCDENGNIHDYSEDEKTVTSATSSATGSLMGGEVGVTNFLSGDLTQAKPAIDDPDHADSPNNKGWYLMAGTGGAASVSTADGGAKVSISQPGQNGYSIQLMHQFPLTEGYEYELTFEAKADKEKSITAQMSDYQYTDFIGSWDKYSDVLEVPLTKNWKTYTFKFNMTESTDDAARLELNLGAGTTDAVYVRNASLKAIGIYEGRSEEDEKEPVKGGEHIYNGTFDQGNNKDVNDEYTRLRFWNTIGTVTAKVDKDVRNLRLSGGATADAGIEQKNVQLLGKDTYKVSFDAAVDTAREISVKAVGNDGTVYVNQTVELPAGDSTQGFEFTVPENASEQYGALQFIVGTGGADVVLDNVSMKRLTNYNVDYSNIQVYPIKNGNFENGLDGWTTYGNPTVKVENNECTVTAEKGGNVWDKMLISNNMQIVEGLSYQIHFDAKANVANELFTAKIENATYTTIFNEECTTKTSWTSYDYEFIATTGGAMQLKFLLAQVTNTCNITFKNVKIAVKSAPILQAPYIQMSTVTRVGEDLVLPLVYAADTEEEFKAAAKEVIITMPDKSEKTVTPTLSEENSLIIPKDVFTEEGNYVVRLVVKGFDYTEFDLPVYPAGDNLIMNGSFNNGLNSWGYWCNTGEGTPAGSVNVTASKEGKIDFVWANDFWDLQLAQNAIQTEAGSWYMIQADVRSTVDRPFRINFADSDTGNGSVYEIFKAGNQYNTYTLYCQPTTASSKLEFFFGNERLGSLSTPAEGHSVYVDNVIVKKMSDEDIAQMIPTVTSNGSVKLGEDAEFTLSNVKSAWSNAEKSVYVDGKLVEEAEVSDNAVIISANAFKQTGYYEIVIKADGFADTNVVFQRVLNPGIQEWLDNGDFSQGGTGWSTYQLDNDNGGIEYKNGKAVVTVNYTSYSEWGPAGWTTQLIQKPTDLEVGKNYVLTFTASTDLQSGKNFEVEIKSGNQTNQKFTLTQEEQTFTMNFTPDSSDIEIGFFCGNSQDDLDLYGTDGGDNSQSVPAHTITISNVSLTQAGASEVDGISTYRIEHYQQINDEYVLKEVGIGAAPSDTTVDAKTDGLYKEYEGYTPIETVSGSVTSGNVGNKSGTLTLKLYYKAIKYNVAYVLNNPNAKNSAFNKNTYAYGTGMVLRDATCTGKVFNGWYLDADCTIYMDGIPTNQSGDITLYAAWRDPEPDDSQASVKVTGITLNKAALTLTKGASETLAALIVPANATDTSVTWTSGNTAVATVDANGKVTAVTKGTAVITARTTDGGYTATCTVTVTEQQTPNKPDKPGTTPQTVSVTGVTLTKTLTLAKGKTKTLVATVAPANATNKKVTWKSSNSKVVTVDQNGKIKAVKKGTATITVTTADGSKTATCKVTVNIPSTKVKLNTKKIYVVKGKSVKVKATLTPLTSTDKVTWSAKNKKVATVKSGKITAKKVGSTTITAKTTSGKKATLKVTVVKKATKSTSIKLNKKTLKLKKGARYDLVPTLKPAKTTDAVKWKSSNKKVATVDAYGTVTAKKKGKATITVTTASGKKATCKVTVK